MKPEWQPKRFDPHHMRFKGFYNVQKVLPAIYDDSLSYYELLAKIEHYIKKLTDYVNALADYQDVQDDELSKARQELIDYTDSEISELKQLIDLLEASSLDWDVQHGYYIDSQDAMRDMFNDVTVHSYTLKELDEVFDTLNMDVRGLSECGLSVKGLALMSHMLMKPDKISGDYVPSQPASEGDLTVSDLNKANIDENGYIYVPSN